MVAICPRHRSLFRHYGAPVAGPGKQLLLVHERYLRKALGLRMAADRETPRLIKGITDVAFEPRPIHFQDDRGRIRQASYEAVVGQVERIRRCHPTETNAQLADRLWWAFLAVQYVEMSGVFVHQDRHHFWTSVIRLLITDTHRQKPSSRYAAYLNRRLNQLLAPLAARWYAVVEAEVGGGGDQADRGIADKG